MTEAQLHEVGLRWNASPRMATVTDEFGNLWLYPCVGRRTAAEYWRRRRLLDAVTRFHELWDRTGRARVMALEDCRQLRWRAVPAWRRGGAR